MQNEWPKNNILKPKFKRILFIYSIAANFTIGQILPFSSLQLNNGLEASAGITFAKLRKAASRQILIYLVRKIIWIFPGFAVLVSQSWIIVYGFLLLSDPNVILL